MAQKQPFFACSACKAGKSDQNRSLRRLIFRTDYTPLSPFAWFLRSTPHSEFAAFPCYLLSPVYQAKIRLELGLLVVNRICLLAYSL
jgi:hypothetical protein